MAGMTKAEIIAVMRRSAVKDGSATQMTKEVWAAVDSFWRAEDRWLREDDAHYPTFVLFCACALEDE